MIRDLIQQFVDAELSPDALSKKLGSMADEAEANLVEQMGYQGPVDRIDVSPTEIDFVFRWVAPAAQFALGELRDLSPIQTGAYRDRFFVVVDGEFAGPDSVETALTGNPREIIIGNLQPYNRKIAIPTGDGGLLSFSPAANLFAVTADRVNAEFVGVVQAEPLDDLDFPGRYQDRRARSRPFASPALRLTAIGF